MPTRRLLYLSAYRLTAFRWERGELLSEAHFEATEQGQQLFAAYLAQHATSLFSLLSNAPEEGFHIETLPFLRGAHRKAVIKRKLGQLFFNVSLTTSQSLGYERSRRKSEHVLLAALSGKEFHQPWLDALSSAQVALSGVYSLAFLGSILIEKLKIHDARCLLLSVQDQSLRQSYFENGKLHFSRLTALQDASIVTAGQAFASEAHKLQQYLASQRVAGHKQPISVYLLAHSTTRQTIEQHCLDTPKLTFKLLPLDDSARTLGMKSPFTDNRCETLFLHLLASAAPRVQFADDELRHHYHLWFLRQALLGVGALTCAICLLLAGKLAVDTWKLGQETRQLMAEANEARQRYASITQTFPRLPVRLDTLSRVVDRYAALERGSSTPDGLYGEISHALDTASTIRIEGIDWSLGAARAPDSTAPPRPPTALPGSTPSASLDVMDEVAVVRGSVHVGSHATPRQILAAFDQFLGRLKKNPQLHVSVLRQPVDLESGKSVQVDAAALDQEKPRVFGIQISRRPGS
jgi:hypothetical protein